MRCLRRLLVTVVCFLAAQAWAGSPTVFVSTGTAGNIYSIDTASGSETLLVSTLGADYEGMVVAPDNSAVGSTRYLVYACDTANNKIVRFDPTATAPITPEAIYSGGALTHPQCGRITATGDLIVTSQDVNGGGVWVVSASSTITYPYSITSIPLGSASGAVAVNQAPLTTLTAKYQGVALKNTGDLLIVDNANGNVLHAPVSLASIDPTPLISGLSQPLGIARGAFGDLYVSDQGGKANILHFNSQGQGSTTCQTFKGKDVPNFLQTALDDTLYAAVASGTKGSVLTVKGCKLLATTSVPFPAIGLALAPSATSLPLTAGPNGDKIANFGFAAMEISQVANSCSGQIAVNLYNPTYVAGLINTSLVGGAADPIVNLGLDGFVAGIGTAGLHITPGTTFNNDPNCKAKDGTTLNFEVAHQFSASAADSQLLVCSDLNDDCQPGSVSLAQLGTWPINGYLPQDSSVGGVKKTDCNIFLMNSKPNTAASPAGAFCGFQSPVNNTFNTNTLAWDLPASSFSAGKSVPVKIKLASAAPGNSCQSGSYVTGATVLLAVAQTKDTHNNQMFVPIGLVSNGSSGLAQPLFKGDNNQQYLFNWDTSSCILPSGATGVCPKGTYSVSVEFLTDNTATTIVAPLTVPQSIYNVQTTFVILK